MYLQANMLNLIVISIFTTSAFATSLSDNGRVVNGTNAYPGEIPYIVSLRNYNTHNCGGSILDKYHILTAAHCVSSSQSETLSIQYVVTRISANGNVIPVSTIITHEKYSPGKGQANDIAVLKLARPLTFNGYVQPVALPQQNEAPPAGRVAMLAGWGLSYTGGTIMENLQRVNLLVYSDKDCSKAHGSKVNKMYHLCSGVREGGKGQCSGDSGGPLMANGKLIGVASWSVKPCTIKGYLGVYSRVSSYVNWIKKKMQL